MYGELTPIGSGDPIKLHKKILLVGRRHDCDVCIPHRLISGHHCRLFVNSGYWFVRDLDSRNGTRVNDRPVRDHRLDPGDILSLANRRYQIQYVPADLGAVGPPPVTEEDERPDDIFGHSLWERSTEGSGKSRRGGGSGVGKRGSPGGSGVLQGGSRIGRGGSGVQKRGSGIDPAGSKKVKKKSGGGLSGIFRRKSKS